MVACRSRCDEVVLAVSLEMSRGLTRLGRRHVQEVIARLTNNIGIRIVELHDVDGRMRQLADQVPLARLGIDLQIEVTNGAASRTNLPPRIDTVP